MFGKKIEVDERLLRQKNMPILHRDPQWLSLFGNTKNREILKYKKQLYEIDQKEKELERLLKKLNVSKLKAMEMIIKVSDSVNNDHKKEDVKLLDDYKEKVIEINDSIDETIFELENLPADRKDLNVKLISATITEGYEQLSSKEGDLKKTLEELDVLNNKVKALEEKKEEDEEWINKVYVFMHGLLGNDLIEKIDRDVSND